MKKWLHSKEAQFLSLPQTTLRRLTYGEENPEQQSHTSLEYLIGSLYNAIQQNSNFLRLLCSPYHNLFPHLPPSSPSPSPSSSSSSSPLSVTHADIDKVKSTLKIIARDWSKEGAVERLQCYQPILDELDLRFPTSPSANKQLLVQQRKHIRVLSPGTGLSRLTWEIANLGFTSQGNEFSFYMLTSSNFILNSFVCR